MILFTRNVRNVMGHCLVFGYAIYKPTSAYYGKPKSIQPDPCYLQLLLSFESNEVYIKLLGIS